MTPGCSWPHFARPQPRSNESIGNLEMKAEPLVESNESLPDYAPVVVAGGGPVGLALAVELAAHGVRSLVVERRDEVSPLRPRAKTTSARTMEHFRRWGLAGRLRARAGLPVSWSNEAVFCTSLLGREITRIGGCFGLDLGGSEIVAEPGQQIPQPTVEQVLREAVAESPYARLVTGMQATAAGQNAKGAWIEVGDGAGVSHRVRADWVAGCEGARSVVRDAMGARYEGNDDSRPNFNVVFRAPGLAERVEHGPAVHYWVLSSVQPGVLGRLDLGDLWWGGANGVDASVGEADPRRIVTNLIGADVKVDVLSTDAWQARMLLADRYRQGRLFIAGDTAHQNPPWGGHGFNTGIGDAVNLGWKLAAVVNGWAPPSLLESYEAERRPIAADTIAEAVRNMAILAPELAAPGLAGSDAEFDRARRPTAEAIRRTKDGEFHSLGLTLGYRYDTSPIISADTRPSPEDPPNDTYVPTATPGARLPHWWVAEGKSIYDRLGPDYCLLGDLAAPAANQLAAAAAALGVPLRLVGLDAVESRHHLDASLVLVRPDQHVAWRGEVVDDPHAILRRATGHSFGGSSPRRAATAFNRRHERPRQQ